MNEHYVLVVDSNAYPFNILLEYGQSIDENTSVITELEYVLASLSEEDRTALTDAIHVLLATQGNQNETDTESVTETSSTQTDDTLETVTDTETSDTVETETTEENATASDSNVDENGGT